jgi:Transposase DDE domain
LLIALIRDPGKGTLKGLQAYLPPTLKYWTTWRLIRSSQWDAEAVVDDMATATLRALPPPTDGVLDLMGDRTLQDQRGRKHPLGHTTRHREHDPYTFGFEMVLLIASWGRVRVPVALAPIDPKIKGHQNIRFRQMLKDVVPPAWVRQVVVVADAGFAANATLHLITESHDRDVFAMPRTRKLTNGTHLRDLGQHLPKRWDYRRARHTPDGRRRASWVLTRRATLHHLGDVTRVWSKKRRHDGPKGVNIIVTHLTEASVGAVLSRYAWRWGVEVMFKERKSGWHLGQMQVTKDAARVRRVVLLSVLAYLLLVRLYGCEEAYTNESSLFKRKERLIGEVAQDAVRRTELKWQRQVKQFKEVA